MTAFNFIVIGALIIVNMILYVRKEYWRMSYHAAYKDWQAASERLNKPS